MADKEDPVFRKRPPSEFGPDWERVKPDIGKGLRVEHVEAMAKNPAPTITITTAEGAMEYPFDLDKLLTDPNDWKAYPVAGIDFDMDTKKENPPRDFDAEKMTVKTNYLHGGVKDSTGLLNALTGVGYDRMNKDAAVAYHDKSSAATLSKIELPEGTKKDDGKDPWDLLAWDAVREVVKVLAFGVRKYERRNWEKGIKYSRCYSAAIRHLTAWWAGEETDNESGLNHLAHAMCCVLFLLAYRVRGMDQFDDRPHKGEIK